MEDQEKKIREKIKECGTERHMIDALADAADELHRENVKHVRNSNRLTIILAILLVLIAVNLAVSVVRLLQ